MIGINELMDSCKVKKNKIYEKKYINNNKL